MGPPTSSSATCSRLKREDFRRTKHDSAFSDWKILIGAYDWEDHSMAKEGAEKYRTQNLPNWTSCPGVYELGISSSRTQSGRGTRKFDSNSVVPVYLGQADNLRTRLQQYGRDGSHLENGCSNNKLMTTCQSVSSNNALGLFTGVFSRGLPIVYRCAPMESKKEAEITEKQLLDKFDYAWNKDSNGKRRQDDIGRKLDRLAKESQFSLLAKKFLFTKNKKVGIKIRTCEPHSSKNGSTNSSNTNNNITFSRIFGIKRLQPTQTQYGSGDYSTDDICGVAIGHGSVCTASPVGGRKRCAIHKGLRINGYISKEGCDYEDQKLSHVYCGFILDDGSTCEMKPVGKNKRCLEHKGRKIIRSKTKFVKEEIEQIHATDEKFYLSCGFILEDGSACEIKAVGKNKRCLEHKGRKISKSQPMSVLI